LRAAMMHRGALAAQGHRIVRPPQALSRPAGNAEDQTAREEAVTTQNMHDSQVVTGPRLETVSASLDL
jgi:hypothetical protein